MAQDAPDCTDLHLDFKKIPGGLAPPNPPFGEFRLAALGMQICLRGKSTVF